MTKWSASDFSYYTAKAGDIIKGSGKGDMNTGVKVILASAVLTGGIIAVCGGKILNKFSKKKR